MPANRAVSLSLLLSLSLLPGCEWFTTFQREPKIDPWESADSTVGFRGNPQNSVPIYGAREPGYRVSYSRLPGTIDSMASLVNPVPADQRSLENGHKYFAINCMPCHGQLAQGDGEVTKFGMPGINLTTDLTKGRSDGYIWGMIRNGRGLMPTYNRIEDMDRWDIVNYLRALQRDPKSVATGPVGVPGETGAKVPGYTWTAPTRPAPYYNPMKTGGNVPNLVAPGIPGAAAGGSTMMTDSSAAAPAAPKNPAGGTP